MCSVSLLLVCCSEEQLLPDSEARVETNFGLETSSAMDGKIAIQQVYLKLDHIRVIGTSANRVTNMLFDIAENEPPYQLAHTDSSQIVFTLPAYTYDELDVHLFLHTDNHALAVTTAPVEQTPDPVDQTPEPAQGENNSDSEPGPGSDNNGGGNSDVNEPDDSSNDPQGGSDDQGDGDHGDEDDHHSDGDEDEDVSDDNDSGQKDDDRDKDDKPRDDKKDDDKPKDDKKGDKPKDDKKGGGKPKDDKKEKDEDAKKDKDGGKKEQDENKGKGDKDDKTNDKKPGPGGRTAVDGEVVDLDGFFQNARPALVVFATYTSDNSTVRLIFTVTDISKLSLPAQQDDGSRILLGPDNTAKITFDANQWFDSIKPADIEAGSLQMYQGQEVLFIHKDYNTTLYEAIASRLESSAKLTVHPKEGQ